MDTLPVVSREQGTWAFIFQDHVTELWYCCWEDGTARSRVGGLGLDLGSATCRGNDLGQVA